MQINQPRQPVELAKPQAQDALQAGRHAYVAAHRRMATLIGCATAYTVHVRAIKPKKPHIRSHSPGLSGTRTRPTPDAYVHIARKKR